MEELDYYRITIKQQSNLRALAHGLIALLLLVGVAKWPGDWSWWLYLTAFGVLGWGLVVNYLSLRKNNINCFYLADEGQLLLLKASGQQQMQLLTGSVHFPFVFHLKYQPQFGQARWLTLYQDQISEENARRLRRVIYRLKDQSATVGSEPN